MLAVVGSGVGAGASAIARNPAVAGATMAFLVALSYVSANALWYQPYFHEGAFFMTREARSESAAQQAPAPVPRPRPAEPNAAPEPDRSQTTGAVTVPDKPRAEPAPSSISRVQTVLADLDLYDGPVDGLMGPQTHAAIKDYQRVVGLETSGRIDDALLRQLGLIEARKQAAPEPTPRPERADAVSDVIQTASTATVRQSATGGASDGAVKQVQAGLRAFGNDGIEADGVMGADTRAAIREFQSLFGLPVTGEPDAALLAKMKEIGLTN